MNVKLEVISVHPDVRSVVVNVYTDAILLKYQTELWPARVQNLIASGRFTPEQEEAALTQAKQELRPGWYGAVSIYADPMPTGVDLVQYLIDASAGFDGPGSWLKLMDKCAQEAPLDMSSCVSMTGTVYSGTTRQPPAAIPVSIL